MFLLNPSGLDIIGYTNKSLWIMKIRVSLHLLTRFHWNCLYYYFVFAWRICHV